MSSIFTRALSDFGMRVSMNGSMDINGEECVKFVIRIVKAYGDSSIEFKKGNLLVSPHCSIVVKPDEKTASISLRAKREVLKMLKDVTHNGQLIGVTCDKFDNRTDIDLTHLILLLEGELKDAK